MNLCEYWGFTFNAIWHYSWVFRVGNFLGEMQYVVFAHWMLCCSVGYVEKGGGLTSHDRLNSLGNYLLLGFLFVRPSLSLLLLVRQSVT